jgi:quercetin dioxygenase-like cupin family protein
MNNSIRKYVFAVALVACVLALAWHFEKTPHAPPQPIARIQLLPGELKWDCNPKLHGLQTAILAGNPNASEPYAERIKLPAHFRLPPHSHPNAARMVTVLSGTLYYATGDTFDETKLKALPAGSFFTEPKDMVHFAMTKDEEVILQLNAIGPDGTKLVGSDASPKPK